MTTSDLDVKRSRAYRGRIFWLFMKYQLLTKTFLAAIIYPIYSWVVHFLLNSSGRTVFSSGDFMSFLLSVNGLGLLVATLVMMIVLIGLDINSFVVMTALIKEGKIEMTARHMIMIGLKSLKQLFSPLGLLLMIYISLIFPLLGLGITVSPMKNFQIPNFITSVIYANPLYLTLYTVVLIILAYISYRFIFVFHYVLIEGTSLRDGLTKSATLTKTYGLSFLKDLLVLSVKRFFKVFLPLGLVLGFLSVLVLQLAENLEDIRFLLFFVLLTISEIVAVIVFLFVPVLMLTVTDLFYYYNDKLGSPVSLKMSTKAKAWLDNVEHRIKLRTKVLLTLGVFVTLGLNLIASAFLTYFFDDLFRYPSQIQIIAHRAGGDLGAENTLEGIEEAIKEGASWTEIDIQRTKDGAYVLNHDGNFSRVAGEDRTSAEMTLAEIKDLQVKNSFDASKPSQPVPTMDEVVAVSKGKIGLFMELKGATADTKMVDDMVALIKREKLEKEAVLLSLDYKLITYIEETYPEIQSGYLYYFAIGQTDDLLGDYLIMEEREATPEKVSLLKSRGKKVVVWTVNTPESIEQFVNSDVDGIITDYVLAVKEGISQRDKRSDLDIIVDAVFG